MNRKKFAFSRKNGEGFVIETPAGNIAISLHKRKNGKLGVVFDMPKEAYKKSLGVYRIGTDGVEQNREVKGDDDAGST